MTYIVLARKWRPMKFEELVGQEHVIRTLMNALKQGRIAHAYIFAGPRGVGKTTTARLLAKAVNCEKQPVINPCNECDTCKSITEGHSLDVIEIDGASNRGIDEIRNLRDNIRFSPAAARYKIYIIDEVHMLTKEAFNALLKTLEEPPAHAIFIFATTEIHKVPLTILSRCQRFDFKRIPANQIASHLEKIARTEKIKIDKDSLLLIARKAEGAMRDAQSILDQLISYTEGKITVENVQTSLGLINEELYFRFTDLMQDKNDAQIIEFAQKVFLQGHDLMDFIFGLEEHFRNLLVARATGSVKMLDTSDHFKKLYQEKMEQFTEKDLLHYIDILTQSENLLKFSPNPQLILELLLLKLAHKPLTVDLENILSLLNQQPAASSETPPSQSNPNTPITTAPRRSSRETTPGTIPPTAPPRVKESRSPEFEVLKKIPLPDSTSEETAAEASSPIESISIEFSEVQQQWEKIVDRVKVQKIALGSFLQDAVPYKIVGNQLQIAFDPSTGFHMEHVQKNARAIEEILKKDFNLPLQLKCVAVKFEEAGIKKQLHSPQEILEDIKNKEPVLKKIIELFDCENLEDEELSTR